MAGLSFDITGNNENFLRKLEETKRGVAEAAKFMRSQSKGMDSAFSSVSLGGTLKKQIYEGSQSINGLTAQIIKQKGVIKDIEQDVRNLGEAYRKAGAGTPKGNALFADFKSAKGALQEEKAALFELQTQQAQARLSVRKLKDEYSLYQKEGQNVVESNEKMALSFKKTLAAVGGTAMIRKFIGDVIKVRGQFQQLDVAFTTLLQSKEKANALMAQMVETAAKTPFNLTELATGAKQLVAYGFASEGVNDTLIRLGNIASGLGLPLERLTYLYGTTMTQGRLYARDLMQFTTSGIPMLQGLADMYGVSTDKVNEMVTAGKIGFPEVQKVIENLTNEGGKFFNLMEEQSKTITGKISNLGDAWDEMLNKIGQSQEGDINNSIDGLKYLVENYETVGKILTGLIGVYGTYRTAAMLVTAVHSLQAAGISALTTKEAIHYAWLVATKKAQLALNATMLTNPYVLLATAVVGTVAAIWAFHDSTTAAERVSKSASEALDRMAESSQNLKTKIDGLLNTIREEASTQYDKEKAYERLQDLMPTVFSNMDIETLKLMDHLSLNKQINEELNRREIIGAKTNVVIAQKKYDAASAKYQKDIDSGLMGAGALSDKTAAFVELETAKKVLSEIEKIQSNAGKSKEDAIKKESIHNKEYWENLKKETQSQLDALTDIEASGKKGADLKQKINEYDKKINSFSASNTTKQENQAAKFAESLRAQQEKYNLLMDKQTRDRVRAEEDAANEIEQAQIDTEKDGAEKVLKQRELNHKKEIQAIVREAYDRKQAVIDAGRSAFESAEDKAKAEDPKHVKKTFDEKKFVKSDDAIAEFLRINKVAQGKVDAENAKYNRGEDLKGLLDEYQDFADQRLAIEKKFNEDIKVLDAQRKTALENGDMEQVAKIDRSKVQAEKNKKEDLSGVSLEEFKTDIDWATLFGNLDVLSPESLNKLRDKLKAFIETAADKLKPEDLKVLSEAMTNVDLTIADKTPYEALKVGLSGYKVATGDAATAQEKLNKLQKDGKDGTQEYKDATKELTDAQRRRAESLKTVTQAANNIGSKGMEVVNAGNEIVGMLENFGVEVPEAVGKTLEGVGQIMSGLENIDLTKPFSIVTGAISILTGIGNTIAGFLGFGKENKTLKDTQRLEETTNRLAETEKVINSFIEKRIELLKDANIEEQKNIATTTQAAIDNQKKYYEQQLDGLEGNWLLAKAGKNNNLTLKDLGITSIKELEEFLSSDRLLELQKNGYSIRDAEKWQEIIDGNNSVLDKEKELQETMAKNRTGISLDEAQNALDDFIKDADSSFGDVADSFEDHMRDAMFNIVKQNYLNKALEDWYKDFEEAMSDGELSKAEAEESKKKYEDAYTGAQERYLNALKAAGISAESDPSREATQKGIATASQDSVDENNGRLTVIQGHTYSINESVTSINGNTAKIVENLACMTNISQSMKSILDMKDIELKHLSDISRHTENLVEMKQFMYSMKQGIDTLNTKGLTLKR